jgi:hypothetical protein
MVRKTKRARWTEVASVVALAAGALVGAQIAGATSAMAVSGIHIVSSSSTSSSTGLKQVQAYCPVGERVIGGGGFVQEVSGTSRKPTLTELRPIFRYDGTRDAYRVTAAETVPGTANTWLVSAYAVCAPAGSVSNWGIVRATTPLSSNAVQSTAAVCPSGRRVLGTGISVSDPFGEVVLQIARSSGPGDIARAQAHEDVDGYAANWSVSAYAICTTPPIGYVVPPFGRSTASDSENWKIAQANCPTSTVAHSAGAAVSTVAPGNVSLQAVFPTAGLRGAQAIAVENTPTNADWDFMVAAAACAR